MAKEVKWKITWVKLELKQRGEKPLTYLLLRQSRGNVYRETKERQPLFVTQSEAAKRVAAGRRREQ